MVYRSYNMMRKHGSC